MTPSSLALLAATVLVSPSLLPQPLPTAGRPSPRVIAAQERKFPRSLGKAPQHQSQPRVVHAKPPRQEPCWKVAGISPEVIARRRVIAQETRERVRQICTDASLSDQQKRQEIRQVRQAASQESFNLVTPEQRAAVKQCNEERAEQHPRPVAHMPRPPLPNPRPHPTSPCGELR